MLLWVNLFKLDYFVVNIFIQCKYTVKQLCATERCSAATRIASSHFNNPQLYVYISFLLVVLRKVSLCSKIECIKLVISASLIWQVNTCNKVLQSDEVEPIKLYKQLEICIRDLKFICVHPASGKYNFFSVNN